jgi:hypothetical protein
VTAWENAKTNDKNPLSDIRTRYKKYGDKIGNRGKVLYSTLSGNIHTYRDGTVEVDESQWNWDDFEILKALTPSGGPNARHDRAKERRRYLYENHENDKDPGSTDKTYDEDNGGEW